MASSAVLATLPDDLTRRRFILDCTGCHTFRADIAWPDGATRTEASWRAAAARMIGSFGPHSGFPVIGPGRNAAETARWLAASLPATPPSSQPLPPGVLAAADVREYLLPAARDLPHDVAVQDGRVVITGMMTGVMYVLDPATGAVTQEPTPAPNPRAVELDGAGNWWVVLGGPRMVAKRAPDGRWSTWDVGFYAHSVAVAPDGGVWVNGHFTHEPELLRRVDPATGEIRDVVVPTHPDFETTPVPYEIRAAPDGAIWMSELQGNRLVRVDPEGAVKTWVMPTPWSGPRRLDVDPRGMVWIPEYAANRLARFDPATERFDEWTLPVDATAPYIARHDAGRNAVWIGTGAADMVFRFDVETQRFRAYRLPSHDQLVRHLVVDDATGDIWLAPGSSPGTVAARVVRLRPRD